jgi:hypothetical protein
MANYKYKKEDFKSSTYSLKDYELHLICEALDFAERHNLFTGEDELIADDLKWDLAMSKASSEQLMDFLKNDLHKE